MVKAHGPKSRKRLPLMHQLCKNALPLARPSFNPRRPLSISCNHACSSAGDRALYFGKYTLPSSFLLWVSNNLRAWDFEHWATLADLVLRDPLYNDRIEWEFAEAVLNGNNASRVPSGRDEDGWAVAELLEISERFGWDNEDKAGWSREDFELLEMSRGGRIPRVGDRGHTEVQGGNGGGLAGEEVVAGRVETRKGRRVRVMMKLKMETGAAAAVGTTGRRDGGGGGGKIRDGRKRRVEDKDEVGGGGNGESDKSNVYNSFPGREGVAIGRCPIQGDHPSDSRKG